MKNPSEVPRQVSLRPKSKARPLRGFNFNAYPYIPNLNAALLHGRKEGFNHEDTEGAET
jgi:hypothetical protein